MVNTADLCAWVYFPEDTTNDVVSFRRTKELKKALSLDAAKIGQTVTVKYVKNKTEWFKGQIVKLSDNYDELKEEMNAETVPLSNNTKQVSARFKDTQIALADMKKSTKAKDERNTHNREKRELKAALRVEAENDSQSLKTILASKFEKNSHSKDKPAADITMPAKSFPGDAPQEVDVGHDDDKEIASTRSITPNPTIIFSHEDALKFSEKAVKYKKKWKECRDKWNVGKMEVEHLNTSIETLKSELKVAKDSAEKALSLNYWIQTMQETVEKLQANSMTYPKFLTSTPMSGMEANEEPFALSQVGDPSSDILGDDPPRLPAEVSFQHTGSPPSAFELNEMDQTLTILLENNEMTQTEESGMIEEDTFFEPEESLIDSQQEVILQKQDDITTTISRPTSTPRKRKNENSQPLGAEKVGKVETEHYCTYETYKKLHLNLEAQLNHGQKEEALLKAKMTPYKMKNGICINAKTLLTNFRAAKTSSVYATSLFRALLCKDAMNYCTMDGRKSGGLYTLGALPAIHLDIKEAVWDEVITKSLEVVARNQQIKDSQEQDSQVEPPAPILDNVTKLPVREKKTEEWSGRKIKVSYLKNSSGKMFHNNREKLKLAGKLKTSVPSPMGVSAKDPNSSNSSSKVLSFIAT